jgi:competence protein ComEC
VLWLLLPWVAGVASARVLPGTAPVGWLLSGAAVLAGVSAWCAFSNPARALAARGGLAALAAAMLLGGAAAYEIHRGRLAVWETLPPREARLVLRVERAYAPNPAYKTVSGIARVVAAEPHLRELVGQRLYYSLRPPPGAGTGDAGGGTGGTGAAATAASGIGLRAEAARTAAAPTAAPTTTPAPTSPSSPQTPAQQPPPPSPPSAPSPPARTTEFRVTGVLQPLPRNAAADTFDGYLTAIGANFRLTRGRIHEETRGPAAFAAFCERARAHFEALLGRGIAGKRPELAGVLRAMLLGQKHDMQEDQVTMYLRTGTMHLFAISGLHIGVIALGIHGLLAAAPLPRWARFGAGVAALWLFVQITGATPSAVRAFWMIFLLQLSFQLRVPVNPLATLAFAALVSLVANPLQLFSASFQMSYGIVGGLLLFGVPLGERWQARRLFADLPKVSWERWRHRAEAARRAFFGALGIGVASSLVSAICGVIYFGLFTPGALLANLVLIPLASVAILGGLLSLLTGLCGLGWAGVLFNHAAALVLLVMQRLLEWFLLIPGIFWPGKFEPAWTGHAALACLMASFLFGYAHRWSWRRGGFLAPVAVVAAALAVCVKFGSGAAGP